MGGRMLAALSRCPVVQVLSLLSCCPGVYSHGYLSKPSPRNVNNCGDSSNPYCINDVSTGQGWTGSTAPGETPVPEPACGAGRADAKYTTKGEIMATYTAGQTVNVEYKVNANHGGHVAYRLCLDGSDTEDCFREQYLENEDGEIWMQVPNAGGGFLEGATMKNTIRIPDGVSCEKCTLSWRWDSDHGDVSKVRVNCADISIIGNSIAEGDTDSSDDGGSLVSFADRKTILWSLILAATVIAASGMTTGSGI